MPATIRVRELLKREWMWDLDKPSCQGVRIERDGLFWYLQPRCSMGAVGASKQRFDAFLKDGPPFDVPSEIVAEIRAELTRVASKNDSSSS